MIYYKCKLCGRVFKERIPHTCGSNFRKHHIEWEEINDEDYEKMLQEDLVKAINWEQVRINAAIAAMQGKLADHTAIANLWKLSCEDTKLFNYFIASAAVELADALVINLKKGNKHDGKNTK